MRCYTDWMFWKYTIPEDNIELLNIATAIRLNNNKHSSTSKNSTTNKLTEWYITVDKVDEKSIIKVKYRKEI